MKKYRVDDNLSLDITEFESTHDFNNGPHHKNFDTYKEALTYKLRMAKDVLDRHQAIVDKVLQIYKKELNKFIELN